MSYTTATLYEARDFTGQKKLQLTSVPANITLRLGFVRADTIFRLHWFESYPGEAVVGQMTTADITWNTVKLLSGLTLAMWTDPHGQKYHFLFRVSPWAKPTVATLITAQFARREVIWQLMAECGVPYRYAQRAVSGAGPKHAAAAIRLVTWLGLAPDRPTPPALVRLAEAGAFSKVRSHLSGTEFIELPDEQLVHVLQGARLCAQTGSS
ncbi:MAG TPA: hypothetical protein VM581_01675 [Magnetospirillaceae bacterium]|nr:hypothetical protein [Magnetospirillaceae bacterium]